MSVRRLRALAAVTVITLGVMTSSFVAPGAACAAERGARAVLVVDGGSEVLRLCVDLGAESVSGIELIELAGRQQGLGYSLGFGGQAVCSLAGVGVSGGDCFSEYPEFWGYWHGDGGGGWTWAGTGAGSTRIGNGDVEGWVWGSGDTADSHERPPSTRFVDVCHPERPDPAPAGQPSVPPEGGGPSHQGANAGQTASPSGHPEPEHSERPERSSSTPTVSGRRSAGEVRAAAGSVGAPPPDGPGVGLILGFLSAIALIGGGWLRLRSRGAT